MTPSPLCRAQPRPASRPPCGWACSVSVCVSTGASGAGVAAAVVGGVVGRGGSGRRRRGGEVAEPVEGTWPAGSPARLPFPGCVWGSLRGPQRPGLVCAAPRPGPRLFAAARFFSRRPLDRRSSGANFERLCLGSARPGRCGPVVAPGGSRGCFQVRGLLLGALAAGRGRGEAPVAAGWTVIVSRGARKSSAFELFSLLFPVRFCSPDGDRWSSERLRKGPVAGLPLSSARWPL